MGGRGANPLLAAVETYYEELTAFVRRRVRCPALTADIVQETWLKAAAVDPNLTVDNPRAYLYRVAGNLATDRLRQDDAHGRHTVHGPPSEDVPSREPLADAIVQAREEMGILLAALRELPAVHRKAFVLYKGHGLSMKEVAATLGLSPRTVEKHVAKAMVHCRRRLREAGREI